MAMVRTIILPSEQLIRAFSGNEGGRLLAPPPGSPSRGLLVFERSSGDRFVLSSDYVDVEFKFEVFFISLRPDLSSASMSLAEVITIPVGTTVEVLFRASWLRRRCKSTLPEDEALVEEQGHRSSMPSSCTAAALAPAGIALLAPNGELLAAAVLDDQGPLNLKAVTDTREFQAIAVTCERIDLRNVSQWAANLSGWHSLSDELT